MILFTIDKVIFFYLKHCLQSKQFGSFVLKFIREAFSPTKNFFIYRLFCPNYSDRIDLSHALAKKLTKFLRFQKAIERGSADA